MLSKKILIFFFLYVFFFFICFIKYKNFDSVFKIIKCGDENSKSFVTVVGTYYKFPSKHSSEHYVRWTDTFLSSVSSPLVIFTDQENYIQFKKIADRLHLNVTFFVTNTIWDVFEQIEKWRGVKYTENYLTKQQKLDPEKHIHNPNLYAVWNSKHYMIKLISEINPYKSDFFIYTDMGAWRNEVLKDWPDVKFVKQVSKLLNNKALYGQIENINVQNITGPRFDGIEGTFFAGSKKAIENIAEAFYVIHDSWLKRGEFVGKDQMIMNHLAYKQYPNLVKRLMSWDRRCKQFNDVWFFYQVFFSHSNQYFCHGDKLSLIK